MRIDQRKKWYQKIKYNKNFKTAGFMTVIIIMLAGFFVISGRTRMGDDGTDAFDENLAETIVIDAPDDPVADLQQYLSGEVDDVVTIDEYDYSIQETGGVAERSRSDRSSGGVGYGGESVTLSGMGSTIRVILTSKGSYTHSYVEFSCNTSFTVTADGVASSYGANELVSVGSSNTAQKLVVAPDSADGVIAVSSLSKAGGTPRYHGVIEIAKQSSGYTVINEVNIEQYLYGVVSSEVSSSFCAEALKAQAVCARGYAYRKLGGSYKGYDANLDDTTACQVYNNRPETSSSINAVQQTAGLVPTYNGQLINPVYFSTSCGTTCTSEPVWGGYMAYTCARIQNTALDVPNFNDENAFRDFMDGKTDTDVVERNQPMYRWTVAFSEGEMRSAVEKGLARCSSKKYELSGDNWVATSASSVGDILSIEMSERDVSGLLKSVTISGSERTIRVTGQSNMRVLFATDGLAITEQNGATLTGWTSVPSNFYYVKKDGDRYILRGGGYGHGVGMSQNGANELAKMGYSCSQIIVHYYNGAVLSTVVN